MTIDEIFEAVKAETSIKSYKIENEKSNDLTIFESKFGGIPYWDFSKEFPTDSKGKKLNLLAQINFDKENFNNELLPKNGMLQFYISSSNDIYGANFDEEDEQTDWRVVYHESVNYDINEKEILDNGVSFFKDASPDYYAPFTDEYKIKFIEEEHPINIEDDSFDSVVAKVLKDKFNVDVEEGWVEDYLEQIDKDFYKKFSKWGHKLLGYPTFTQSDPRCMEKYSRYDTLLLQIDSDDDIMWGDVGVANFFINKEDLKNKDFSRILYNWDCC